ncbi:glycoside hydrolase family 16 protein [Gordonia sp. VNK21]|uniref:glycoside hydrolase family 16 protein n=1 Tax=Gordonia sp. VNK21 TaxID=3382483 RepID=UPI0038D38C87
MTARTASTARRAARLAPLLATTLAAGLITTACSSAAADEPEVLFADEFDGLAGPVGQPWTMETGGGGWGNDEMQVYTDDPANVRIDGDGHLAISARYDDGRLTSGRVSTYGGYSVRYGTVSARIALPAGQGLHPAFWLLGDNIRSVGWPTAGEIDVIETLNDAGEYHTSVKAPRDSVDRGQEVAASGVPDEPLAGEFRTYWMRKEPGRIQTGIDDTTLLTATPGDLAPDAQWVFDAPFHLLLNLAVGGNWSGPPDEQRTPNPSTMLIDWVRVTAL